MRTRFIATLSLSANSLPSPQRLSSRPEHRSGSTSLPSYKINQQLFAKAALVAELQAIFSTREDKIVFVKGDTGLSYGVIAEVVGMAHQAEIKTVVLVTPAGGLNPP